MRTSVWKLYCSLWLDSFCVARWPHGRSDCGPSEPTCKIKCKGEVEWVNKHNSDKITVCILNNMYLISSFNSPLFLLPVKSAQAKLFPRVLSTFYVPQEQNKGEWVEGCFTGCVVCKYLNSLFVVIWRMVYGVFICIASIYIFLESS